VTPPQLARACFNSSGELASITADDRFGLRQSFCRAERPQVNFARLRRLERPAIEQRGNQGASNGGQEIVCSSAVSLREVRGLGRNRDRQEGGREIGSRTQAAPQRTFRLARGSGASTKTAVTSERTPGPRGERCG